MTASQTPNETTRVRQIYEALAPTYDRKITWPEKLLFGDGRAWVCAQAYGQVLEIAVGTGRNFPLYPADVTLTGIDVSPAMLAIARERAQRLGRAVELQVGDAQVLPFPDAQFDTAVSTLSLCSVPDERQVVAEVWRVLRHGACSSCWSMCAARFGRCAWWNSL